MQLGRVIGFPNRGATKRAIRMRAEPDVDAMGMESVVTVRKETAFVVVFELRQANGAFHRGTLGSGGVYEGWKRFENGRLKSFTAR